MQEDPPPPQNNRRCHLSAAGRPWAGYQARGKPRTGGLESMKATVDGTKDSALPTKHAPQGPWAGSTAHTLKTEPVSIRGLPGHVCSSTQQGGRAGSTGGRTGVEMTGGPRAVPRCPPVPCFLSLKPAGSQGWVPHFAIPSQHLLQFAQFWGQSVCGLQSHHPSPDSALQLSKPEG